jgi:hypothetical protein
MRVLSPALPPCRWRRHRVRSVRSDRAAAEAVADVTALISRPASSVGRQGLDAVYGRRQGWNGTARPWTDRSAVEELRVRDRAHQPSTIHPRRRRVLRCASG